MFFTHFKRIVRTGFVNFWRNSFVTAASILVMTTTLFVLGSFLFLDAMLDQTLDNIASRVDINIYFTPDARESDILAIQESIEKTKKSKPAILSEYQKNLEDLNKRLKKMENKIDQSD